MENSSARLQACAIFAGFCVLFVLLVGLISARDSRSLMFMPQQMLIEKKP